MEDIYIIDTETTGLVDPIALVEFAYCKIGEDFGVIEEFTTLINPGRPIPCGASGIHGVRDEDVVDAPLVCNVPFPEGPCIIVGHNLKYDRPLLERHMKIVGQCCTLTLARRLLPDAPDHKLPTLSCYCGLPKQLNHRALNDVRDCLGLLDYLAEGAGWSFSDLVRYSNTPLLLKEMPWGKHKGVKFEHLPSGYVRWLQGLDDLDLDMAYTMQTLFG